MRFAMQWILGLVLGLAYPMVSSTVSAAEPRNRNEASCKPDAEWEFTKIENALWFALCRDGRAEGADLPTGLFDSRNGPPPVSAAFLRALFEKPMRDGRVAQHVDLSNVKIVDRVELTGIRFVGDVSISASDVTGAMVFSDVHIDGSLRIANVCTSLLQIDASEIKGNLLVAVPPQAGECPRFDLVVHDTDIGGNVQLTELDLRDARLNGIHVGRSLVVDRSSASIFSAQDAHVGGSVDLRRFHIKRDTEATNKGMPIDISNIVGLSLRGLVSSGDVNLDLVRSDEPIDITNATITGSLSLRNASFESLVDLSRTNVSRGLVVGTFPGEKLGQQPKPKGAGDESDGTRWGSGSELRLVNASAGVLETSYTDGSWPQRLDLSNFTFSGFLSQEAPGSKVADRVGAAQVTDQGVWFQHWLDVANGNGQTFNPQPYENVSHYLTGVGQLQAAQEIRIAEKTAERRYACNVGLWGECVQLWALYVTIEYGYVTSLSLCWVVWFTVLGACVFMETQEAEEGNFRFGLAYSFDLFIPLIKLREWHYKIDLKGYARYYFYFHKLMGWIIGSFLAASLAGLTK